MLALGGAGVTPLARAQGLVVGSSLSPARHARTASVHAPVGIGFSQAINPGTVGGMRILSSQSRGRIMLTRTVAGNLVTLTPITPAGQPLDFRAGETVSVVIPASVASTSGTAAGPFVYQFTTATTGGSGNFQAAPAVSVSSSATSTAAADLDGDGDLDLLTSSYSTNRVSVRLNNGMGGFTNGADLAVGNGAFFVVAGDLDGDEDLDFVATNVGSNDVSVRLNAGNGAVFTTAPTVWVGNNPRTAALADIDGDGDLDLLTANAVALGSVSVRFNNGQGVFSAGSDVRVGQSPYGLALGDMDNDGDLDVVTANASNSISVRYNDGQGAFSGTTNSTVLGEPICLALGDVDGDGDLDAVAGCSSSNVAAVLVNDGTGALTAGARIPVDASPLGVQLGDVDSDGDLDLLAASFVTPSVVSLRLNNGAGEFSGTASIPTGQPNAASLVLADIDGNGTLDCLTAHYSSSGVVSVLRNAPAPTAASAGQAASPLAVYPNPAAATAPVYVSLPTAATGGAAAQFTLLNALGQTVATQRLSGSADGGFTATLPTAGLPAGIYLVRLQAGSALLSRRLVLQ
ncbi:FG-GAP-like repeat-containing protein [Hymenobacter persicinus]|uniref:FG-GAP-like repeat-containing protein n=1 Tax=Hymenobacter persicinus TaxID=2025506 RepID=UPI0013EE1022|nr:FG-GAP-like repeat-containing protein [Hymenobacter persicinus]